MSSCHIASVSPHVKSSMLMGSLKSMWRAMNSPAFDFQGDPLQQGGTLIVGPGDPHIPSVLPISTVCELLQFSQKQTIFYFSPLCPHDHPGPEVHFAHFDSNRLDHMPIHWLLQLVGLPPTDFREHSKVIDI